MTHCVFGLYRRWPPRHCPDRSTRLALMGWPLHGTDQAEGPKPTQMDHRYPLQEEEVHVRRPLYGPRFRTATT